VRHVQDIQRRGGGDLGGGKPTYLHIDEGARRGIGGDGDRYLKQRDGYRAKFRGGGGVHIRVGEMLQGPIVQRSPGDTTFTRQRGGNREQVATQVQQLEGMGLAHHSDRGGPHPLGHGSLDG